jgi:hypothetical protein
VTARFAAHQSEKVTLTPPRKCEPDKRRGHPSNLVPWWCVGPRRRRRAYDEEQPVGSWYQSCGRRSKSVGREATWTQPDYRDESGALLYQVIRLKPKAVAKTIRIVLFPDLKPGGDVSDWLDADTQRADELVAHNAASMVPRSSEAAAWLHRGAREHAWRVACDVDDLSTPSYLDPRPGARA